MRKTLMLKILNTLFFIFLLSACSTQNNNENNQSTKSTITTTEKNETVAQQPSTPPLPVKEKREVEDQNKIKITQTTPEKEHQTEVKSNKNVPLFTLTTLEGKKLHIRETAGGLQFEEFKNKAVILIFFGHKCPPCLAEIPILKKLRDKGNQDLEIIGVEVQRLAPQRLKTFVKQKGINYNIVSGNDNYPFISYISQKANWTGAIPFLLGFDKKGSVEFVHLGGIGAQGFDNIYNTLSKENNSSK